MYPFLPAKPNKAGLQLFSGCRPNIHKSTGWTSCQQVLHSVSLTSSLSTQSQKKLLHLTTEHHVQWWQLMILQYYSNFPHIEDFYVICMNVEELKHWRESTDLTHSISYDFSCTTSNIWTVVYLVGLMIEIHKLYKHTLKYWQLKKKNMIKK